jgi:hypothetical protein
MPRNFEGRVDRLEQAHQMRRGIRDVRDLTTPELIALLADLGVPTIRSGAGNLDISDADLLAAIAHSPGSESASR